MSSMRSAVLLALAPGALGATFADSTHVVLEGCFYEEHDYRGDDLPGPITGVLDYKSCQSLCQQNADCFYFNYFASTQECHLDGKDSIFEDNVEHSICGPKYCPRVPSGCTEVPSEGFPGNTADETEAMFPSHRQPEKLECWPRTPDNKSFEACPKTTVLETTESGWPGKCEGLELVETAENETCESKCLQTVRCSVYAVVNNEQRACYFGEGVNCYQPHSFPGNVVSKRIMHGEVRVIAKFSHVQVFGLQRAFGPYYFINQWDAVEACRNDCYSNLECEYWQYSKTAGCYVENSIMKLGPSQSTMVQYPLTRQAWTASTNPAHNVIAGEYIQHLCPGKAYVPADFSMSFVPQHLQYGPKANAQAARAIKRYNELYPNVGAAPPAAVLNAYANAAWPVDQAAPTLVPEPVVYATTLAPVSTSVLVSLVVPMQTFGAMYDASVPKAAPPASWRHAAAGRLILAAGALVAAGAAMAAITAWVARRERSAVAVAAFTRTPREDEVEVTLLNSGGV